MKRESVRAWTAVSSGPVAGASRAVRNSGYVLALWFVSFAAVNAWHLATGIPGREDHPEYGTALVVMSVVVFLLKLVGAAIVVSALRPRQRASWLLGATTWGAASVLVLYSAGSLVLGFGMASGLIPPSDAWTEAGGLTMRAIAYVLFFAAGGVLASILALSVQRRHQPAWTAAAGGAIAAPILLGSLLILVPVLLIAVT